MHIMCLTRNIYTTPFYLRIVQPKRVALLLARKSSSVVLSCRLSSRCRTVNRLLSSIAQRPRPKTWSPLSPPLHNDRGHRRRAPRARKFVNYM